MSKAKKTILYDNKDYPSYSHLARDLSVDYRFMMRRLNEGNTLVEAVKLAKEYKPTRRGNCVPCCDHVGNQYYSMSEMARFYNKPSHEISNRLAKGWNLEDALTLPSFISKNSISVGSRHSLNLEKKRKEILAIHVDHKGNIYDSNDRMLKEYNIHSTLFLQRMIHGWTLRESLVIKPNASRPKFHEEQEQLKAAGFEIEDEGFM